MNLNYISLFFEKKHKSIGQEENKKKEEIKERNNSLKTKKIELK